MARVTTLRLSPSALALDWSLVATRIKRFIRNYIEKSGMKGIVLGVSGGLDSSTTAALASQAIGGSKVLALSMPEEETYNPEDTKHIEMLAEEFDFQVETIDISQILRACYDSLPLYSREEIRSKGNLKARIRMVCWYYYANILQRIVCGNSDKSETMMGYYTKWGDVAADISPLMDLYKTQVKQLAAHIGVPREIITKPPTPALWPGQTAEGEMGIKYETLDLILLGLETFLSPEEIARQLKLPLKLILDTKARLLANVHKRRMPLTTKLGYRTVGKDFRLPYMS
ncbi:MAG: NAD+ synthase [Candidatus Bathyarchaeota archaeon]|nr:NAD+ synthase [Candidatus Bathyarchaeota archaeon]UCD39849.1 MAG: NAD+ synthase [Candidatus Bathyarchaeota archaeon]